MRDGAITTPAPSHSGHRVAGGCRVSRQRLRPGLWKGQALPREPQVSRPQSDPGWATRARVPGSGLAAASELRPLRLHQSATPQGLGSAKSTFMVANPCPNQGEQGFRSQPVHLMPLGSLSLNSTLGLLSHQPGRPQWQGPCPAPLRKPVSPQDGLRGWLRAGAWETQGSETA